MIKKLSIGVVFLGILFLYFFTLAPSVAPQGDSGEVVTNALFLGINHPPGYPLYTLLGHIFTLLPLNSVAWRVNLFSALTHWLALFFLYKIIKKIGGSTLIALGTTLIMAFSYTFWLYSLVAEVFPLNNFFAAALIYLSLTIYYAKTKEDKFKYWWFLVCIAGIAFFHHQTIILILPAIAYLLFPFFWKNKSLRVIISSGGLFLLGAIPYLFYLFKKSLPPSPSDWSYPQGLIDVIKIFLRMDYGTLSAVLGKDPAMVPIAEKLNQVVVYFRLLYDDFLIFGVVLAIFGFGYLFLKQRRLSVFFALGFFLSGPFFLSYANFPYTDTTGTGLAILERFYLLPNLFVVSFIGSGLIGLQNILNKWKLLKHVPLVIILFYLVTIFFSHFSVVNQRDNYLARDFAQDILSGVPPGGLIVLGGDVPTFTTFYVRYVENYRQDIDVLAGNQFATNNNYKFLKNARPELDYSLPKTASPTAFLASNLDRVAFRIYPGSVILPEGYIASPSGFSVIPIRKVSAQSQESWTKQNDTVLANYRIPNLLTTGSQITSGDYVVMAYYINLYVYMGDYCREVKDYTCAIRYYQKALDLDPIKFEATYSLARTYENISNCQKAEDGYLLALKLNPEADKIQDDLARLSKDCFKDNNFLDYDSQKERKDLSLEEL